MARRIKFFGVQQATLPIKNERQLNSVLVYLNQQKEHAKTPSRYYLAYRNYMLFLIGFNTAFRAEDLLQLRVADVVKGFVSIKENKTGKVQNFRMNKQLHEQILEYIKEFDLKNSDYLFMGQKKKDTYKGKSWQVIYPITRQNARNICKDVAEKVGIDFKFGLHSLRKTFGYMYIKNGGNVLTLMKMYNHYAPDVTLLYVMWGNDDAENDRESTYIGMRKTSQNRK